MGDENHNDIDAELAALKAQVDHLYRHIKMIEMHHARTGLAWKNIPADWGSSADERPSEEDVEQHRKHLFGPLETVPVSNDITDGAHTNEGERRLQKIETQLAELMACHEIDLEHGRQFIEHRLGRPPTADEVAQMARGVKLSAIVSAAAKEAA
jgi:hypothetical protein